MIIEHRLRGKKKKKKKRRNKERKKNWHEEEDISNYNELIMLPKAAISVSGSFRET